ncbi:MAG: ATP synthase F1 subunit epsilon [Bdellovibrionales bacterium]
MLLNILTPTQKLVQDLEVEEVIVPAHNGELDVLEGHAPLMSTLDTGVVRYREKIARKKNKLLFLGGYLEVNPKAVNILSETAEEPTKIDLSRVTRAITEAEEKLAAGEITLAEMEKYQRKLRRAHVRKLAVEGNKTSH